MHAMSYWPLLFSFNDGYNRQIILFFFKGFYCIVFNVLIQPNWHPSRQLFRKDREEQVPNDAIDKFQVEGPQNFHEATNNP